MNICRLDDCDEVHYGKTFCKRHYGIWYRWGDPEHICIPKTRKERFDEKWIEVPVLGTNLDNIRDRQKKEVWK